MKRNIIFILFVIIPITKILGQNDSINALKIESKYHFGNLLDHRKVLAYVQNELPKAIDFQIVTQQNNKAWKQLYKFPSIGFGVYLSDFGNPDILGKAAAIYFLADFPIVQKQIFKLNFRFAEGYGYLTKKFDTKENYLNVSIGSHNNLYFALAINSKLQIYNNLQWINAIGITHFSNGSTVQPNLGLNLVSWQTGFSYSIDYKLTKKFPNVPKIIPDKKNHFQIFFNSGIKEINPPEKDNYLTNSFVAQYYRQLSPKRKIGGGFDIFNDPTIIKEHKQKHLDVSESAKYCFGVNLAHDWIFGKLSFTLQQGFYLYSQRISYNDIYQRYGFRYEIYKNWLLNLTLKTYLLKADLVEVGIGYSLHKNKSLIY